MISYKEKIDFENNCFVALVDSDEFNISDETRIRAITDIASITKGDVGFDHGGKEADEAESNICPARQKFYNELHAGTAFEFVPVRFDYFKDLIIPDNILEYSTINHNHIWTNMRAILNSDWKEIILCNTRKDVNDFKVIVGRVPAQVISYLRSYKTFSFLTEFDKSRDYLHNVEFWYPSHWDSKLINAFKNEDYNTKDFLKDLVIQSNIVADEAVMELSYRRLVYFTMAAWKQDEGSWDNLFAKDEIIESQDITAITINNIKKLI